MPRTGILSKFYVNIQSTTNPIWQELPLISDCVVNGTWQEGDASMRASRAALAEPTLMGIEVTGKIRVKNSEQYQSYQYMYISWLRDVFVDLLVLNGTLTENNSEGFRFQGKVFTWSEDQGLGQVLYKDFSVKPCIPNLITNNPTAIRVVGGVLVPAQIGIGFPDQYPS